MWKKSLIALRRFAAFPRPERAPLSAWPRTSTGSSPSTCSGGTWPRTGRTQATIVGQYDSETLYLYDGTDSWRARAVPGPGRPLHPGQGIGQHVIGNVEAHARRTSTRTATSTFAPTRPRSPSERATSCSGPSSRTRAEVLCSPEAEALLARGQRERERAQVEAGPTPRSGPANVLFPGVALPPSLARAVDGSYFQTHLRAHANVVARSAER